MRLSGVFFAALLLLSASMMAQRFSGGGSTGGSSGGGSHGGSSGASFSSSSGGHSGGDYSSHISSSHGTSVSAPRSVGKESGGNESAPHFSHSNGVETNSAHPEKKTFFSFWRHPFHKPQPKAVAYDRRPGCGKRPCPVCPAGSLRGGHCGAPPTHLIHSCSAGHFRTAGDCLLNASFVDDCGALRMMMERQRQAMETAESARIARCATGWVNQCMESSQRAGSEADLYTSLSERYRQCRQGSFGTFRGFSTFGFSTGLSSDPLRPGLPSR